MYAQGKTKPLPSTSDNLLCPVIFQIILLCSFLKQIGQGLPIMWAGHWNGECIRERKCCFPCVSPAALCTKAKVAKGEGGGRVHLRDTTVIEF